MFLARPRGLQHLARGIYAFSRGNEKLGLEERKVYGYMPSLNPQSPSGSHSTLPAQQGVGWGHCGHRLVHREMGSFIHQQLLAL